MSFNRRQFINSLLAIGSAGGLFAIFYPLISYLIPPKAVVADVSLIKAGKESAFPPDSSKILEFGKKPIILIRDKEGKFYADSAVCTHLQCIVQFKKNTQQIWCACHNGLYTLNGRNISGPPPRPLKQYRVNILNDQIVISK
jgi:Rieske Fe-S protein